MDDYRSAPAPASSAARTRPPERGSGIPLGRLLGVPIYLAPSWLLLAALITLTYGQFLTSRRELSLTTGLAVGFGFVVCLLVSVLLHELGHAITSRQSGIGVSGITLEMLGGYTEMEREAPRPGVELFVSLAGPVVSLLLGLAAGAAAVVLPAGGIAETFAFQLALSNIVVAVFNALPGLPLDGGRALQALVWKLSGDPNLGRRVAGWSGRLVAVATAVTAVALFAQGVLNGYFGLVFTLLVSITMWVGAGQAIRHGKVAASLPPFNARELARPVVPVAADTPLAEAERIAADLHQHLAVVDGAGAMLGFVHGASARAVPPERRPWVPVGDVTRRLDEHHVLPGDLRGTDLLHAIRDDPGGDYLVVTGEDVHGVLRGAELLSLVETRRSDDRPTRRNRT
ncbi:peptidase M50 [Dactylosporangium aurantiacum]|uniref:Zinc metalloprotease n=1 Tax=Dactylosporangium aurantiacum TaxID=35754 RepID=A0A9Q9MJU4_9ACTN|nr:site-2 protease family protein [Dactylosporangium aurantiacum]MDG6108937.1 site-2 protease family protein [Dactylosporangium aurantiacum]UWZ52227.1 peptidase M50 [Dactylosporangium aurantiacum]